MGEESKALATRETPPKLSIAGSLDAARDGEVVVLDRRGNVMSTAGRRARLAVVYTLSFGALAWTFASATGTALVVDLVAFPLIAGAAWWYAAAWRTLRNAHALVAARRGAEAEPLLVPLERSRRAAVRLSARNLLAMIAWRRGDLEPALAHFDAVVAEGPGSGARQTLFWVSASARARLLVIMGRSGDAERARRDLEGAPDGEYYRAMRHEVELTLAFHAADATTLPDSAELHIWACESLQRSQYESALGYLAWAFDARDEPEMAAHLRAEAVERAATTPESQDARLRAWLEATP